MERILVWILVVLSGGVGYAQIAEQESRNTQAITTVKASPKKKSESKGEMKARPVIARKSKTKKNDATAIPVRTYQPSLQRRYYKRSDKDKVE